MLTHLPRRRLVLLLCTGALALGAPAGNALASPTVRLTLWHVVEHCHVWATGTGKLLGASTKITVKRGTRVEIRANCPMDFDFAQTSGPRLALGDKRTYAGTSRVIVFRKVGRYRLRVTNVQTPEQQGLTVLGEANTLILTVVVR